MFSDEILLELRELLRRVPLLLNTRIRYTPSALLLNVDLPDPGSYEVLVLFMFIGVMGCLLTLGLAGAQHYLRWPALLGLAGLAGLLLYGILRVNRRVNASQQWPPNFIIDAATRRITLPAPGKRRPTTAHLSCRFEDVARVQARLVSADTGYGELAEVRLDFHNDYPPLKLNLRSYAVAQQLATVLRRIILTPDDAPAAPPETPPAPTA